MDHIDPDDLALIAIGDRATTREELLHLSTCSDCARDLRGLSEVSDIGRESGPMSALAHPDRRVWTAIAQEVAADAPLHLRQPLRRRWFAAALAAVIVGVLAITGTIIWSAVRPSSAQEIAAATLTPLPAWNGASGSATITKLPDGGRQVVITLTGEGADANFHEAWFMTSDLKHLVSVGVITGSRSTFSVPADLDLKRFDVVDISSEPHDGDPHHSGNSIVRGELS